LSDPESIQSSLSRWLVLQTLVGLSAACAIVYATTHWSFQLKQEEDFQRVRELVVHSVEENRTPQNLEGLRHKLGDFFASHFMMGVELNAGDRTLFRSPSTPTLGRNVVQAVDLGPALSYDGEHLRLVMSMDVSGDDRLLHRLAWTLFAVTAGGAVVVSMTSTLLVRRGLKPLGDLARKTSALGPGHPGSRIDASGYAKELKPWIGQFNGLLDRVESAYGQLEAFNADAAHELRTPLANMIALAEVELHQTRSAAALRDALASVLEDAHRLSTIVSDMLFLSKADRGSRARRTAIVSLALEVAAVAEFHEVALEERSLKFIIDGDARSRVDPGLFRRAVSNLVSNAIRYARPSSTIRVAIKRSEGEVALYVENVGAPVPADALPHLFERFFRADKARSGSSGNHGLGLAIVAAIARMHEGTTFAESTGGRTKVGIKIADPREVNGG
jgi:two-component system heavy metal sensor histidine kinase CusS